MPEPIDFSWDYFVATHPFVAAFAMFAIMVVAGGLLGFITGEGWYYREWPATALPLYVFISAFAVWSTRSRYARR